MNTRMFATFLGRRSEGIDAEALASGGRRPARLEHLRIYKVHNLRYLQDYVQPLGQRLRRLDLHFTFRKPVFEDGFCQFLKAFHVLVEFSITLIRRANTISVSSLEDFALSETNLVSHIRYPRSYVLDN